MLKVPEKYRWNNHPLFPSSDRYGNNGFFIIPHFRINNYELRCMVSDGLGWEHLSVTIAKIEKQPDRTPTWAEMCWLKDLFWDKEDCVMQFHPPQSEYVSTHNFCLHLWKPTNENIPLPNSLMVGRKDLKHENLEKMSADELKKIMLDVNSQMK